MSLPEILLRRPGPADLVMAGGRPLLVVPYAGAFGAVGRRVLVAWDGTREASTPLSTNSSAERGPPSCRVSSLRAPRKQHSPRTTPGRERSGPPDVVVVDPPRAGLAGRALRRLGRMGAPRLVYVSCNPTTLAGDVKALREDYGYELRRVTPVDMFPHTPHVECVALLEPVSEPA